MLYFCPPCLFQKYLLWEQSQPVNKHIIQIAKGALLYEFLLGFLVESKLQ